LQQLTEILQIRRRLQRPHFFRRIFGGSNDPDIRRRLGLRSKSRSDRLFQLTRLVGGANLDHGALNKRTAEGSYQDGGM